MDGDSDTAFPPLNNIENTLDSTVESSGALKRLVICSIFAFLTIVTVFAPGLKDTLDASLKTLFTFCALITGYKVYKKAVKDIIKKKTTAEVVLGICTFISFVFAVLTGFHVFEDAILINSDFYFVVTVIDLLAMLFGAYIKTLLKNKSAASLEKLNDFVSEKVRILSGDHEEMINPEEVCPGVCAKVLPGEKIPFDGVVVGGETTVDESALTGKNIPVDKAKDDIVYAGGINKYGEIIIKSLYKGKQSLVFKLIQSAKNEIENGPEFKSITERAAEKYLVFITCISVAIGLIFGILHFAAVDALLFAVMTFILACPVAFAFTEPLLLASVVLRADKENILFRNSEVVSFLHNSDVFVFDKSAILSTSEYSITDFHIVDGFSESEILKYVAGIESVTEHRISDAIFDYVFSKEISPEIPEEIKKVDNGSAEVIISGKKICFGEYTSFDNKIFDEYTDICNKFKKQGKIITFMTVDSQPAAIIAAKDSYKSGAAEFMEYLKNKGIEVYTFDDGNVDDVAESKDYFPDARVGKIKTLKAKGKTVVMIGDGVNDALAFAYADIAIAVDTDNMATIDTADIVISGDGFSDIIKAINIGNSYKKIANQNIISAMVVNFVLLAGAFVSVFSGYFYLGPEVLLAALTSILIAFVNRSRIMKDK